MFQYNTIKTQNIFIFPILFGVVFLLSACTKTIPSEINNQVNSSISAKNSIGLNNNVGNFKTDSIIVDRKQIKTGQTFFIKGTFAPEPYKLTLKSINGDNSIDISYSEIYLGRPCSN